MYIWLHLCRYNNWVMLCNCMRFCCLLLFVFLIGKAGGQEHVYGQDCLGAEETEKDTVSLDVRGLTDYLKYITFLPEKRIDSVYFYANTSLVPVVFEVNKYRLVPTAQLDSVVEALRRVQNDPVIRFAYVWVGGSASPEGPPRWNYQLGERRSRVLADYLLEHTSLPPSRLRVENLWEDWYSFEVALRNGARLENKDAVLRILGEEKDNQRRKQLIQGLDGGRTWHRIIRDVFPPFRNARLVIVCYTNPLLKPDLMEMPLPNRTPALPALAALPPPAVVGRRVVALKTNALFVAALTANLGVEVELFPRWSLDVPVWYSPYDITPTRRLRLLATQPELRWWLRAVAEGHFFGLHTHVVGFNVSINDRGRYQDPNHALWGMGLSYGYAFSLGKAERWGVELTVGAGFAEYSYDSYRNWENGPLFDSGSGHYWGITRAGINLSYKWFVPRKPKNR